VQRYGQVNQFSYFGMLDMHFVQPNLQQPWKKQ
jgi:hypothetical protein